jgi:hypothetical protein
MVADPNFFVFFTFNVIQANPKKALEGTINWSLLKQAPRSIEGLCLSEIRT